MPGQVVKVFRDHGTLSELDFRQEAGEHHLTFDFRLRAGLKTPIADVLRKAKSKLPKGVSMTPSPVGNSGALRVTLITSDGNKVREIRQLLDSNLRPDRASDGSGSLSDK